jgi:hypothetical protein
MTYQRPSSRLGTSSIEALVVVTISSIVLTLLGQMLHRVLAQHHISQRSVAFQRESSRLAYRFRSDLRRCTQATVAGDTLVLVQPQGEITYTAHERRLTITDSLEGRRRREEYTLPPGCRITFAADEVEQSNDAGRSNEVLQPNKGQHSIRLDLIVWDPTFQTGAIAAKSASPTRIVIQAFAGGRHALSLRQNPSSS